MSGDLERPRPERTFALLLGVSECPASPHLAKLSGSKNAATDFHAYLSDVLKLPRANVKNLFDSKLSPSRQIQKVGKWLSANSENLQDLIVFYTGHGGFTNGDRTFFLATRSTTELLEGATSIRVTDLAEALRRKAAFARKYLIFDCCFSAAAVAPFMSSPGALALKRMEESLKTQENIPQRGTAVLCSSSSDEVSIADGDRYTRFSEALLWVLKNGNARVSTDLTLRHVEAQCRERITSKYPEDRARPEIHTPDQRQGDVAKIFLFPNAALSLRHPSPTHETLAQRIDAPRSETTTIKLRIMEVESGVTDARPTKTTQEDLSGPIPVLDESIANDSKANTDQISKPTAETTRASNAEPVIDHEAKRPSHGHPMERIIDFLLHHDIWQEANNCLFQYRGMNADQTFVAAAEQAIRNRKNAAYLRFTLQICCIYFGLVAAHWLINLFLVPYAVKLGEYVAKGHLAKNSEHLTLAFSPAFLTTIPATVCLVLITHFDSRKRGLWFAYTALGSAGLAGLIVGCFVGTVCMTLGWLWSSDYMFALLLWLIVGCSVESYKFLDRETNVAVLGIFVWVLGFLTTMLFSSLSVQGLDLTLVTLILMILFTAVAVCCFCRLNRKLDPDVTIRNALDSDKNILRHRLNDRNMDLAKEAGMCERLLTSIRRLEADHDKLRKRIAEQGATGNPDLNAYGISVLKERLADTKVQLDEARAESAEAERAYQQHIRSRDQMLKREQAKLEAVARYLERRERQRIAKQFL